MGMKPAGLILLVAAAVIFSVSCKKKENITAQTAMSLAEAPRGFPEIPFTEENPYSFEKWQLGKKLFYETAFSVDYSISCASCHKQEAAFSDVLPKSKGAGGLTGRRNAPSLANVAYHPYYTREGGVPTLEMQILVPIQEHDEFNFNIVDIAERLKQMPDYVSMSRKAFGREPDAYVITRAIGIFERTLVSGNSPYDQYKNGNKNAMPPSAQRGAALFFSHRTSCSSCHSGFNFTDYSFANNGLYEHYQDIGRQRFTGKEADNALFKVPTLRNIALTAPYMHDGSIATLAQVIEHYNSGGKAHPHKSEKVRPLGLTQQEKNDLLSFLNALTDHDFVTNKNFYNDDK